jgi:hypothetical protein
MLHFRLIFADMYDIMDLLIDDTHCMGYNTIFLASLMFVLRATPNMISDGPTASGCGMWYITTTVTTVLPYTVRALAGDPACEPHPPINLRENKKMLCTLEGPTEPWPGVMFANESFCESCVS